MKRLKRMKAYLIFTVLLGVFILPGCGGDWDKPSADPTVSSTVPVNNATGVATGNNLTATFSEEMDSTTISVTTFSLMQDVTDVPGTVTYSGVTAVFSPTNPLDADTVYTATITIGATDLDGNALAGDYVWSFTTGLTLDAIAPTVTSTVPLDLATGVATNSAVTATFNEAMEPATISIATFTVKETVSGTNVAGSVSLVGTTATFTPTNLLATDTNYTATVTTGAQDLAGNALAADEVWSFTTSAVLDIIAPLVTSTAPLDLATGVATNSAVTATFNEAMESSTISTATFTVKETVSETDVSGNVSLVGTTATFTPTNPLAAGTDYTVTVTTGAQDLAGNALENAFVWTFTTGETPDTISPTVTAVAPLNNALDVPINTKTITAAFSKAMNPATLTPTSFTLAHGDDPAVLVAGGEVTYVSIGNVATLTLPGADLLPNTEYTAVITVAAKDVAGNALENNFIWTFTTGATPDTTPPTVTATGVYDTTGDTSGATGLPVNRSSTAIFSEPMNVLSITTPPSFTVVNELGTVAGTVTYAVSSRTATFKPTVDFEPNTLYTSTIITGAEDLAGNALESDYVWSWTTGDAEDTIRPTVFSTIPEDGEIDVSLNQTISAEFSEEMDSDTITNLTFTVAEGLNPVPGLVTYDLLTDQWTFAPMEDLAPDTTYTVTITIGATDLAGNELEGNTGLPLEASDHVWTFTTMAAEVPPPLSIMSFGIASYGGITNIGATKINGNVVLNPTANCNLQPILFADGPGFGVCGGDITNVPTVNVDDLVITPSYPDAVTAPVITAELLAKWNSISPALRPGATVLGCGTIGAGGDAGALIGCSGNAVLPPGTYISSTSSTINVAGILTLDAAGDADAEWYFQAPSALDLEVGSEILLTGGAKASNVWWFVGSSATIKTNSTSNGNILASASISMQNGATSCGSLLAGAEGSGEFSFLENTVSVPGHTFAPADCE